MKARRVFIKVGCVYIFLSAVLSFQQVSGWLMFHPPAPGYTSDMPGIEHFKSAKLDLAGLSLKHPSAEKVIIYFHGNAEDVWDRKASLQSLYDSGFSVLSLDYPGYGLSGGHPTEKSVYASADTAYRYVRENWSIAPSNIVVVGASIGSGPACYLAERHVDVGGLVLQSGFTTPYRTITRIRAVPVEPFPNIVRIKNIRCPKLFIHGTQDHTVPFRHAQAMYAKATGVKALLPVEGAGHNDVVERLGMPAYVEAIHRFAYGDKARSN